VVYGNDDRRDYYVAHDASVRKLFEAHSVALITDYRIPPLLDGTWAGIPTWQEAEQLCPGEPFAEQPSAAYCSGVLVGAGLVLTSKHCLGVTDLANVRVVFGYYLADSEHLALKEGDVHEIASIVSASAENADGIDYAWLRLVGDVTAKQSPAPVASSPSPVTESEPLIAVNSGGGIPLKVDEGVVVSDARDDTRDYFVANIDAFRGASGSGVFNTDGALVGIVARGNADFVRAESGCRSTIRLRDVDAKEQVVYAQRAIDGLCAVEPANSLCGSNCEQHCRDRVAPTANVGVSCALLRMGCQSANWAWGSFGTGLLFVIGAVRRRARPPRFARRSI